jgi:hypothetical protein
MSNTVEPHRDVVAATAVIGCKVTTLTGDSLGEIRDIAIDLEIGTVAYAVLVSRDAGGKEKFFAVPWGSLSFNAADRSFALHAHKDRVEEAPGFDPGRWPDMGDHKWARNLHSYYRRAPYWE